MYLVCDFQIFPMGKLYHVSIYYIDILNLLLMSNKLAVQKYILSLQSSFIYFALYKPSELVGLVQTALTVC